MPDNTEAALLSGLLPAALTASWPLALMVGQAWPSSSPLPATSTLSPHSLLASWAALGWGLPPAPLQLALSHLPNLPPLSSTALSLLLLGSSFWGASPWAEVLVWSQEWVTAQTQSSTLLPWSSQAWVGPGLPSAQLQGTCIHISMPFPSSILTRLEEKAEILFILGVWDPQHSNALLKTRLKTPFHWVFFICLLNERI